MNKERALQLLDDVVLLSYETSSESDRNELDDMRAYIEKNLQ